MRKKLQKLAALALVLALTISALPITAWGIGSNPELTTRLPIASKEKTLRILAVGNSFSDDSLYYLYYIAQSAGYDVTIGNLYHQQCSLAEHWNNLDNNTSAYTYRKISTAGGGAWSNTTNQSITTVVQDEPWDLITLQQSSALSGVPKSYSLNAWTSTIKENSTVYGRSPSAMEAKETPEEYRESEPTTQTEPTQPEEPIKTPAQPEENIPDEWVTKPESEDDLDAEAKTNSSEEEEQPDSDPKSEPMEAKETTEEPEQKPEETEKPAEESAPEEAEESAEEPKPAESMGIEETDADPQPEPAESRVHQTLTKSRSVADSDDEEVRKQEQVITCAVADCGDTSSVSLAADAETNLSYQSSDESVATVDQTGQVTFLSTGSVNVTITASPSAEYFGAKRSVELNNTKTNLITELQRKLKKLCPNRNVRFGWNMTWAYADLNAWSSSNKTAGNAFYDSYLNNYKSSQIAMYQAITNTVTNTVAESGGFSVYIPTGTAIQNLRSSYVGDTVNRDGVHLSTDLGRYTAALTWAAALGINTSAVTYLPANSNGVSPLDVPTARESVAKALLQPLTVAPSSYTTAPTLKNATSVQLTNLSGGIKLTWKASPNATGYKIWRKKGSGNYSLITTIANGKATSYSDTAVKSQYGVTYTYSIRAISGVRYLAPADQRNPIRRLGCSTTVTLANEAEGIRIKWSKVTGASGYRVYRSDKSNGKKLLKSVSSSSARNFLDQTSKDANGTVYTYTIQAYYGKSVGVNNGGKKVLRLTAVTLKKPAKSGASAIKLAWSRNSKAKGYYLYRKLSGGSWSKLKTITSNATLAFTDKTAKQGRTYYYRVFAYKDSTFSPASNTRTIKR